MIYCIDTSAWLDGWARDYPPDVFPSLWEKLAECVAAGVLKCSEEVYVELEKKDDGLHDWLKARKEVVVPIDEEIQATVLELLAAYPRLVDTHRNRSQADPFVIATAERFGKDTGRNRRKAAWKTGYAKNSRRMRREESALYYLLGHAPRTRMEVLMKCPRST